MSLSDPLSEQRLSDTFLIGEGAPTLTALSIADAGHALDPRCACVVTFNSPDGKHIIVASRGTALSSQQQLTTSRWLKHFARTQVHSIPRTLRGSLKAFRVLATPIASPVARFGVIALTRPAGELCGDQLRKEMEGIAAEWALRLEEQQRAYRQSMRVRASRPSWDATASVPDIPRAPAPPRPSLFAPGTPRKTG